MAQPDFPVPTCKKTARTICALRLTPREKRSRGARENHQRADSLGVDGGPEHSPAAHAQKAPPYLHGHAEVHHGHAGVAVPTYVHHGVAAVRGLALQRGARRAEVVLRLLVTRRLLRGLCGGGGEARGELPSLPSMKCRTAFPAPGGGARHPLGRKSHYRAWVKGSRQPLGREPLIVFSPLPRRGQAAGLAQKRGFLCSLLSVQFLDV